MRTDRKADRHDEANSCLLLFSNGPKNSVKSVGAVSTLTRFLVELPKNRVRSLQRYRVVVLQHVHTGCGVVSHKKRGCGVQA